LSQNGHYQPIEDTMSTQTRKHETSSTQARKHETSSTELNLDELEKVSGGITCRKAGGGQV